MIKDHADIEEVLTIGHFHVFGLTDGKRTSKCGVADPTAKFLGELFRQVLEDGYDGITIERYF